MSKHTTARVKTTFPPRLLKELQREARITENSVAEIIRRAVVEYLLRRGCELPGL